MRNRSLYTLWCRLFLVRRPSIGLSAFRLAVSWTVAAHVIPKLVHLEDVFLSTAFRTVNTSFFPINVLVWVGRSPDWLVCAFAVLFCVSWVAFTIGWYAQPSCIVMLLTCYYFYALSAWQIGTLSWDILLVTLFLMCLTPYHGDYFSVDALRRNRPTDAYRRKRPYFLQRLLQLQIASTFLYTALYKISADGNWLTDNPIYYLMHSPPLGVVREFPFRSFFAGQPELCYWIGLMIIACEITLPVWLFWRRSRWFAIVAGCVFHVVLVVTLHVPTIFLFLFPPQLCLFINPWLMVRWIERRRVQQHLLGHATLIYDGHCQMCINSVRRLQTLDALGSLHVVDFQEEDAGQLHRELTPEQCHSQLHLVTRDGTLYGGFGVFRRLSVQLPMLWPVIPVFYAPGMGWVGGWVYRWVAAHRYLLHRRGACTHHCRLPATHDEA